MMNSGRRREREIEIKSCGERTKSVAVENETAINHDDQLRRGERD
jgi:hypothetical protein